MDDKTIRLIKNYCSEMHAYRAPLEIEKFKKVMKKHVKFFDRNSLLAYMLMKSCGALAQRQPASDFQKFKKDNRANFVSNNDNIIQLWTNVFFYNDDKVKEFTKFVAESAGIQESKIKSIRKVKHCSFIDIEKDASDKVLKAFSSALSFDKLKVIVRPKREKSNEEK